MKIWEITAFKARIGETNTMIFTGPSVDESTFLVELSEHTKLRNENDRLILENDKLRQALKGEGLAVEGE